MRLHAAFLLGPAILLLAAEAMAAPQAPTALPPPRLAFDSDRGCGLVDCVGFGVGVVLGVLVAPIIDIAALSTEEAQAPASEKGIRLQSLSLVPISGAGRKGLAVAGQF